MITKQGRKGQVTIFIIIALIIVVTIALIFIVLRKPSIEISPEYDPQAYIEKCTQDATKESVDLILQGGGRVNPELYIMYNGEKYNYLCYQRNYYVTCVNHYPMLKSIVEQEITEYIEPTVKQCFLSLRDELQNRNYGVDMGAMNITTELTTKKVIIIIDRKFELTKNQETRGFSKFKAQIISPIHELVMIVREIVNQEAQYCNFEYNGFMALYPQYDIKRFDYDESKIYNLIDRTTKKEFKFAIRSCAFPPGL